MAKNLYYGMDFCPGFWDWLLRAYREGKVYSIKVVTHERPSDSVKRVKIPNVCLGLGIKVVSPFEMLRNERARFVLAGS